MGKTLGLIGTIIAALGIAGCATTYNKTDDNKVHNVRFGGYICTSDSPRNRGGEEALILDTVGTPEGELLFGKKVTDSEGRIEYHIKECDVHKNYTILDRHGKVKGPRHLNWPLRERVEKTYKLLKKCEWLLEKEFNRDF